MHKVPNSESGTLYRNALIFVLPCIVGVESILATFPGRKLELQNPAASLTPQAGSQPLVTPCTF